MKLLETTNTDIVYHVYDRYYRKIFLIIVKYSQAQFGFKLPSELSLNCTAKFIAKLQASDAV